MSSTPPKGKSTEAPTKKFLTKLLSKKKIGTKKCSAESRKTADDYRTCEEVVESPISNSIRAKRKKKKDTACKDSTTVVEEDKDETTKVKKNKEKDDKTSKKRKNSKRYKKEKLVEETVTPSTLATVFEAVKAPSRPAYDNRHKDVNEKIKEDMQRIEREEKKEKEKAQQTMDEFAPIEPIKGGSHPALAEVKIKGKSKQINSPADKELSLAEGRGLYQVIPKKGDAVTAREKGKKSREEEQPSSTKTGKTEDKSKELTHQEIPEDADCKTAMTPIKVPQYHMVMHKGVPRYEPIVSKSKQQIEKSEKEVAAKINILRPGYDEIKKEHQQPQSQPANLPKDNVAKPVIGTLPKDDSKDDPKKDKDKDGVSPVSCYIARL